MMLLSIALSITSLFLAVNGWQLFPQTLFSSPHLRTSEERVITPEFSDFVEGLLDTAKIRGLSLAIVRKHGDPEFGAWGTSSEEGDLTTSNVCMQRCV